MSAATVRHDRLGNLATVVLENEALRVVVIPSLGGRVWELLDRERGRQWIWHRWEGMPDVLASGANYDEVWAGGWEELFPNDAPGRFEGRNLPDHGEWWSADWRVEKADEDMLCLGASLLVLRAHCTKEFRLVGPTLVVRYGIESAEREPFHFLFKQHLPVALTPACRLVLPGGRVQVVDPAFGTLIADEGAFQWPAGNGRHGAVDLTRVLPASSREREFLYVRDLPEPWCGVDDSELCASMRMRFDPACLPYVWLFLSYGGWRDCYTAVLEPCTNLPKDLAKAVAVGQSARLAPGQHFHSEVAVTVSPCSSP